MKPVTNALEHDNTCKYKARWIGNRMFLQQKSDMCGIDWSVSSYDIDIREWKINHNGKTFDKVSPAVTWKVKPCAWRAVKEKKLKNRMLIDYFWLYLPRDELVEELGNLPAEIRGNGVQRLQNLEPRVNEACYCSKPSETRWFYLSLPSLKRIYFSGPLTSGLATWPTQASCKWEEVISVTSEPEWVPPLFFSICHKTRIDNYSFRSGLEQREHRTMSL